MTISKNQILCPDCKKYFIIEWQETTKKYRWWRRLFWKYWEGTIIGKDGLIANIKHFERTPRIKLYD